MDDKKAYDKAYEFVTRLFAMYNRSPTDEILNTWIDEMIPLNGIFVEKAFQNLRTNNAHEKSLDMPTVKQFLDLYKRYSVVEEKKDTSDFYHCYACSNKGGGLWWIYDEYTGLPHQLTWYCDHCDYGKSDYNKIDSTDKYGKRRYAVPISELTDINKLIEENKAKKNQGKEKVKEYKKHVQRLIGMVGEIDPRNVPSKYKKSAI